MKVMKEILFKNFFSVVKKRIEENTFFRFIMKGKNHYTVKNDDNVYRIIIIIL